MAVADWESPFSPRAVRIHIVRRSGAPGARHPFLGHPWCERDSDSGIGWWVLATPSVAHLLRVVREQEVEDEIRCPGISSGRQARVIPDYVKTPKILSPYANLYCGTAMTTFPPGFSPPVARIPWSSWLSSHNPKTGRTWTKPPSLAMGGTRFRPRHLGRVGPRRRCGTGNGGGGGVV